MGVECLPDFYRVFAVFLLALLFFGVIPQALYSREYMPRTGRTASVATILLVPRL